MGIWRVTSVCAMVLAVRQCGEGRTLWLQEPIAELVEGAAEAEAGSARAVPVWRPAAFHAASLLVEVTRDSHPSALSRCTAIAATIKASIQAALDSPLVQQPGENDSMNKLPPADLAAVHLCSWSGGA